MFFYKEKCIIRGAEAYNHFGAQKMDKACLSQKANVHGPPKTKQVSGTLYGLMAAGTKAFTVWLVFLGHLFPWT